MDVREVTSARIDREMSSEAFLAGRLEGEMEFQGEKYMSQSPEESIMCEDRG